MAASSSRQYDSPSTVSGASKYLANLPSRGYSSSSTFVSSNSGGMRVYICVHDTTPPDEQDIKTNQQNILIRSLKLRNNNSKDVKGVAMTKPPRKRGPARVSDNRGKKTKTHVQISSSQGRLRALLKERGLSVKGEKDELIARLNTVDSSTRQPFFVQIFGLDSDC